MPKELTRLDPSHLVHLLVTGTDADDTDERILVVAGRALLTSGLDAFEVEEVAASAGVGRSTVYRRYGDRNGLIAAALAHEGRRLLSVLAHAVAPVDDLVEEIVAAFCAGLRMARATGLSELVRHDPLALRLLTVDSAPVVGAARDELAALAIRRDPTIDPVAAAASAEILIRLAISFVLAPESVLSPDEDVSEGAIRRHVVALVVR